MKVLFFASMATILGLTIATGSALAGVISNGALSVTIRNDNGAIDTAEFDGIDYFNPGAPVSDFGFQNGTTTSTFARNNTSGFTDQPVTVSGTSVSGVYSGGGANVAFLREYSLVPGVNVLRVTTSLTNNGGGVELSYFDTFDPDQGTPQGLGFVTRNDVFGLAGGTVGQARLDTATIQDTVIAGSLDPRVTVASGNPFSITNGSLLNDFFAAPFDGDDAAADRGMHIGLRTLLSAGEATSFTYDLGFGTTTAEAQAAFVDANSMAPVPEPSTLALFGIGSCATVLARRRRLRQAC